MKKRKGLSWKNIESGHVRGFPLNKEQEICDLYKTGKYPQKLLAEKYSCSTFVIHKILVGNNIPLLPSFRRISLDLDENYFETIDSEKKAYFLGFIFADGNVRGNNFSLEIGFRDKYLLEIFNEAINSEAKISYRKRSNTEVVTTRITSSRFCEILSWYGIVPNKTMNTHHLPNNIPEKYKRHFLRGVFDGDGWITQRKVGGFSMGYVCNYKTMAEDFMEMANDLIAEKNYAKIIKKDKNKDNSYVAQFQKQSQVKQLATALYKDSTIYLTRKYERAELILAS